jgi:hypothetical protein
MARRARIETTMTALVRMATPSPKLVMHNVIAHAAHYELGGGHDLARWVVQYPTQPTDEQLAALGVPATAEYHSGYVHLGRSHWIYVERRPMKPGTCRECGTAASAALFARRGLS